MHLFVTELRYDLIFVFYHTTWLCLCKYMCMYIAFIYENTRQNGQMTHILIALTTKLITRHHIVQKTCKNNQKNIQCSAANSQRPYIKNEPGGWGSLKERTHVFIFTAQI